MRKIFKILFTLIFAAAIVSVAACSCNGNGEPQKGTEKLSAPSNVKVSDDFVLSFDEVENAVSYSISVDLVEFRNIGKVNSYDVSDLYGATIGVRANADGENYSDSNVAVTTLDHYKTVFADFEEGEDSTDWSGATIGYGKIEGVSTEQSHGGEKSFKIFATNNEQYYGGVMFDTGYYAENDSINFANVKEISFWSYIDTKNLTEIANLCSKYSCEYNADVANIDNVYGKDAGGYLRIFYSNETKDDERAFEEYSVGETFPTNQWYKTVVDVSGYETITDILIYYGNSVRSFTGDNSPGQWSVPSDYCYILYLDDFEVVYKTVQLDEVAAIYYEDNAFTWEEVENASGYQITLDDKTWQYVREPYFSSAENVEYFGVKAVNNKKYSDGVQMYCDSVTAYYSKANAIRLDKVKGLKMSLSEGAAYQNVVTWEPVQNAKSYAVSLDGKVWKNLGNETTYCFEDDYGASELYIKAIAALADYRDSEAVSLNINQKVSIADFEGARADYIGNDNLSSITVSDRAFLGNGAFLIERTVNDNEGSAMARCHLQDTRLAGIEWDKVDYLTFWMMVDDIKYNGVESTRLYNAGNAAVIRLRTPNNNYIDSKVDFVAESGKWYQLKIDVATFVASLGDDKINEIRLYSFLYNNMFIEDSADTNCPENASFNVYVDEISLVYKTEVDFDGAQSTYYDRENNYIKVNAVEKDIEAFYIDGLLIEAEYDNGKVVVSEYNKENIGSSRKHLLEIRTAETVYKYAFEVFDMIISDEDGFQTFVDKLATGTTNGNYLLNADIDASGITTYASSGTFAGVLDGNGHKISGLTTIGSGLAKVLTGTVKNIAFTDGTGLRSFLFHEMSGTFENVYVHATITTKWTFYGVCDSFRNNAKLMNCIFNVDVLNYDGAGGAIGTVYVTEGNSVTMTNVYVVNRSSSVPKVNVMDDNSGRVIDITAKSGTVGTFAFENVICVNRENSLIDILKETDLSGWGILSVRVDNELYFGENVVIRYADKGFAYLDAETKVIVAENIYGDVSKVVIDATDFDFEIQEGKIVLTDTSAFVFGSKYLLTVIADGEKYEFLLSVKKDTVYDVSANEIQVGEITEEILKIFINDEEVSGTYESGVIKLTSVPSDVVIGNAYTLKVITQNNEYIFGAVAHADSIESVWDLSDGTIYVGEFESDVEKVVIAGNVCDSYSYNNGILTVNGAGYESGVKYLFVLSVSDRNYYYSVVAYSGIISDATELQAFITSLSSGEVNGHYILDSDIDASTVSYGNSNGTFSGILDGKGHTIENLNSGTSTNGIVKTLTGTIKNVAFVNCSGRRTLIAYEMNGVLDNIYVKATLTTNWSYAGIVGKLGNGQGSVIRNCVFYVEEFGGTDSGNDNVGIIGCSCQNNNIIVNTYIVNGTANTRDIGYEGAGRGNVGDYSNVKSYSTVNGFLEDADFSSESWSEYWEISGAGSLRFGEKELLSPV